MDVTILDNSPKDQAAAICSLCDSRDSITLTTHSPWNVQYTTKLICLQCAMGGSYHDDAEYSEDTHKLLGYVPDAAKARMANQAVTKSLLSLDSLVPSSDPATNTNNTLNQPHNPISVNINTLERPTPGPASSNPNNHNSSDNSEHPLDIPNGKDVELDVLSPNTATLNNINDKTSDKYSVGLEDYTCRDLPELSEGDKCNNPDITLERTLEKIQITVEITPGITIRVAPRRIITTLITRIT